MKASVSFKFAGVKVPEMGMEFGPVEFEATAERTETEYLRELEMGGAFWQLVWSKIEPLVDMSILMVSARIEAEDKEARDRYNEV